MDGSEADRHASNALWRARCRQLADRIKELEAPAYTSEPPTVEGWYWMKAEDGTETIWHVSDWIIKHITAPNRIKWYGPLQKPEDR